MSKRKKQTIILIFMVVAILATALISVIYVWGHFLNRFDSVAMTESQVFAEEYAEASGDEDSISADAINWDEIDDLDMTGITNILLIGEDKRGNQSGRTRSDSMIICSIDGDSNSIALTSLMRDLYLQIPGYQDNRLNAAYALGGIELLDETIEKNFGIHIDSNMSVNLEGFVASMTAVGPIEVTLTEEEAEYMKNNVSFGSVNDEYTDMGDLHAGVNYLNENQALAYARIRYVGNSDYERTERQRKLLMSAFSNLKGLSVPQILVTAKDILPNLTTDMSTREFLSLVYTFMRNGGEIKGSYRLPEEGTYSSETIRGMQVLVPDLQANVEAFKRNLDEAFGNVSIEEDSNIELERDDL